MRTLVAAAALAVLAAAVLAHRGPGRATSAVPEPGPAPVAGPLSDVPIGRRVPTTRPLSGRVVDWRGDPVPAATVEATRPRIPGVADGRLLLGRVTTDTDGRFELAGVTEGRLSARQGPGRFAEIEVVDPGPHTLRFAAESSIEGRVVAASGPILTGAVILAQARPLDASGPVVELRATSDGDGCFRLGPLSPALGVVLEARAPGHRPQRVPVELRAGTAMPVVMVLQAGRTASGSVRSDDGASVAGARIEAFQGDGFRFAAVTDAAGRFEVDGLDDRPTIFTVRHEDHEPYAGADSTIVLRRRASIQGRVVPSRPGLHVVASTAGVRHRTRVASDGRFRLEGVPRGPLRLDVESADRASLVTLNVNAGSSGELVIVIP